MNYDKLREALCDHRVTYTTNREAFRGDVCTVDCVKAATAISTLQAENEKLRAELERVTAERDAAVKDLNEFLAMDELCPIQCEWCKWKDTFCDGKTPEWRGQKED